MYHGSCLCGGIRFEVDGEFAPIDICHCSQCRKAQGTPFATNSPIARARFRVVAGHELLTAYESSPGKNRWFCRKCGSPIYSERTSKPDVVRIRMGLIDEPVQAHLKAHYHTASASSWWPITDTLPRIPDRLDQDATLTEVEAEFEKARERTREFERKALRKLGREADSEKDDDDDDGTRH